MDEAEYSALLGPGERDPTKQQLDGERAGLAAFDDTLDDVGGQIGETQNPANVRVAQPETLSNLGGIRIFATP